MNNLSSLLVYNSGDELLSEKGVSQKAYELIYQNGAPWEIGEPQPAIVELALQGKFRSNILDVGCGYGANGLYLAKQGYNVCGIDYLQSVIDVAQKNCQHINLKFISGNILQFNELFNQYLTIVDSATFHGFSDQQRITYAENLKKYTNKGTVVHILGFSDRELRSGGPRRLSETTFERHFNQGWKIQEIKHVRYNTNMFEDNAAAILCTMERV